MVSLPFRLMAAVVFSAGIGSLVTSVAVIDLHFVDLAEMVKVNKSAKYRMSMYTTSAVPP